MYKIRHLRLNGFSAWHLWFNPKGDDRWSHITAFASSEPLENVIAWCGSADVRLVPA